jgi:hypothetical protein
VLDVKDDVNNSVKNDVKDTLPYPFMLVTAKINCHEVKVDVKHVSELCAHFAVDNTWNFILTRYRRGRLASKMITWAVTEAMQYGEHEYSAGIEREDGTIHRPPTPELTKNQESELASRRVKYAFARRAETAVDFISSDPSESDPSSIDK